jgi:hypothetical protein
VSLQALWQGRSLSAQRAIALDVVANRQLRQLLQRW